MRIRSLAASVKGFKEKKPGVFYWKSQAFLHFHEDPTGLFVDIRTEDDWERFPVGTPDLDDTFLQQLAARFALIQPRS